MQARTQSLSWCSALCLALAACGGGGGDGDAPPPPVATQLNAGNMLDAAGVAALAHQRMAGTVPQLLAPVFSNYVQQLPAGDHACAANGTLTLTRPAPLLWAYTAQHCDTGPLIVQSGQLQLDATLPDGQGLRLLYDGVTYRATGSASAVAETATGSLTFLIQVAGDLGKRTVGSMSVTSHGRTDAYTDFFIASKTSDATFTQYGLAIRSPRFAHGLVTLFDEQTKALTLQANDGSSVTVTDAGSAGARLDLRVSAGSSPAVSQAVSRAEMDGAIARAQQ